MPTDLECAYAAGLFDGEGSVVISGGVYKARPAAVSLACYNADPRPLLWLQETFGGKASAYGKRHGNMAHGQWVVRSADAEAFARCVLPYSIIKREQLETWLAMRAITAVGRKLTPEQVAQRVALATELRAAPYRKRARKEVAT